MINGPDESKIRILHISDLHLREPLGIEAGIILERFYSIINANAKEKPFSLVTITGDIRNGLGGISVDGAKQIIDNIAAAAIISDKNRINIIPGNHDLSRGKSKRIENIVATYDYANGTFDDPRNDLPFMLDRFTDFFWTLCDRYYGELNPWQGRSSHPHYLMMYSNNALIFLNSSLCCINRTLDGSLILGTVYIKELLDTAVLNRCKRVFFFAHHPIQNLSTPEEAAFIALLSSYSDLSYFWMCGDAHSTRLSPRENISIYQVGSLTITKGSIPDFAIYDITETTINRRVFRFFGHLNNPAKPGRTAGGWKRVYIDPKAPGISYDETLDY